jgi:SAM-dependent methyltransferase
MNPALYHAHHDCRPEDLDFWKSVVGRKTGAILELGFGTGRVALALAEMGRNVTGLEIDRGMLAYFQQIVPQEIAPLFTLHQGDMRSFDLGSSFNLALLSCNTFSIFNASDRRKILEQVRKHLLPGGLFVVSMPNPRYLLDLPPTGELELEEVFHLPESERAVQVYSSWERAADDSLCVFTWKYEILGPDGGVDVEWETTAHVLDPPAEILGQFTEAGLEIIETLGDFSGAPFSEEAVYLIVTAQVSASPQTRDRI